MTHELYHFDSSSSQQSFIFGGSGLLKSLSNRFPEYIFAKELFGKLFISPKLDMSPRQVSLIQV